MSNKTAMQQLIEWGDEMMLKHPLKVLSFAETIDKAVELLEVEKEQILEFTRNAVRKILDEDRQNPFNLEQYYNKTYNND